MPTLRQLIYISRPVEPFSPVLERALLAISQRNNRRADLTGLLACSGQHFLQVLEGLKGDVDPVFERIAADPRHTDLQIVSDRLVDRREYGDWSMAYVYNMDLDDDIRALFGESGASAPAVRRLLDRLAPDSMMGGL